MPISNIPPSSGPSPLGGSDPNRIQHDIQMMKYSYERFSADYDNFSGAIEGNVKNPNFPIPGADIADMGHDTCHDLDDLASQAAQLLKDNPGNLLVEAAVNEVNTSIAGLHTYLNNFYYTGGNPEQELNDPTRLKQIYQDLQKYSGDLQTLNTFMNNLN